MATVNRFEDLEIWKLAFEIYKKISVFIERMRKRHDYRFADQMKSAAGSVMDNIAEGFERNSRLELVNSLGISKGELGELRSQCHRGLFDGYIDNSEFENICCDINSEISQIAGFIIYLNKSETKGLKFKNGR